MWESPTTSNPTNLGWVALCPRPCSDLWALVVWISVKIRSVFQNQSNRNRGQERRKSNMVGRILIATILLFGSPSYTLPIDNEFKQVNLSITKLVQWIQHLFWDAPAMIIIINRWCQRLTKQGLTKLGKHYISCLGDLCTVCLLCQC